MRIMPKELQRAEEQDKARAAHDRQLLIWARELGVTLEELRSAVEYCGPIPETRDQLES